MDTEREHETPETEGTIRRKPRREYVLLEQGEEPPAVPTPTPAAAPRRRLWRPRPAGVALAVQLAGGGSVVAGIAVQFGPGWAAIIGGVLLILAGEAVEE